ncbi:MAG TPA: GntR family transcriptional regulator [Gaiellaceae bacterium]|jgi:DNA-binding GntR family transcriptional regulator|nr:GntR family transcriptional regulator [Gaiellaceae bacterium]
MSDAFVRPASLPAAVLAELRRRIGSGELRPGARIRAEHIAEDLGVSRIPVREALKALEGEGQVIYEPRRGFAVASFSMSDLRELYRMRELLEAEALASAVPDVSPASLTTLDEHRKEADAASVRGDLAAYGAANRRFHLELFALSGRTLLVRTIVQLWDASDAYRALYANSAEHRAVAARDHAAITRAVRRGDARAAISAQHAHRKHALDSLACVLGESESAARIKRKSA